MHYSISIEIRIISVISTITMILGRFKMATENLSSQQKADRRWAEKNRERRNYLSKRSTARSFINNNATAEDLVELEKLIKLNLKKWI